VLAQRVAQLSKALLVRNHPFATQFTDCLFEVFDDKNISWDAAKAIGKIGGTDAVLTKQNHAVIRVSVVISRHR